MVRFNGKSGDDEALNKSDALYRLPALPSTHIRLHYSQVYLPTVFAALHNRANLHNSFSQVGPDDDFHRDSEPWWCRRSFVIEGCVNFEFCRSSRPVYFCIVQIGSWFEIPMSSQSGHLYIDDAAVS